MFDAGHFIHEMSRKHDVGEFQLALKELWPICFDIYHRVTEVGEPLVEVDKNIIEVKAVYIDQIPLSKTREILLDSQFPTWRLDENDEPHSYIWRERENAIRLYPPPDAVYTLWLLVQKTPLNSPFPKWFHLVSALRAVEMISSGDQVVGRAKMGEFMKQWKEAFYGSFG